MIYNTPSTPITQRKPVLRDGRWYSSQAAADAGPKPTPRRSRHAFRTTLRVAGVLTWLSEKR